MVGIDVVDQRMRTVGENLESREFKSTFHVVPEFLDDGNLVLGWSGANGEVSTAFNGRVPITWVCVCDNSSSFGKDAPASGNIPCPTSSLLEGLLAWFRL